MIYMLRAMILALMIQTVIARSSRSRPCYDNCYDVKLVIVRFYTDLGYVVAL